MKIIKINGIEVECLFVMRHERIVFLSRRDYESLRNKYSYKQLKVIVSGENEVKKVLKLIYENNKFLIEFEELSEEFYIRNDFFSDIQDYINAGFLDIDFIPTNPKLTEKA